MCCTGNGATGDWDGCGAASVDCEIDLGGVGGLEGGRNGLCAMVGAGVDRGDGGIIGLRKGSPGGGVFLDWGTDLEGCMC